MTAAVDPSSVAAGETEPDPEGTGVDRAAREALAAIMEPAAFRFWNKTHPGGMGWEYDLMRHTALVYAERALAAGYRLVSEEPS